MMKNQLFPFILSTTGFNLRHLTAGVALFVFTLPLAARAQAQAPASAPPAATAAPALSPKAPPHPTRRPRALEDRAVRRAYVKARPFASFTSAYIFQNNQRPAGVQLDYGIEYNGRRGLWVGLDVSPFVLTQVARGIPYFAGRLNLGYSAPRFAIGASIGGGIFSSLLSFGPVFRFGRLDGTHARLRFSFSLLPLYYYFPSGEFELNVKVRPRIWFHVNVGGDLNVIGMYSTFGTQLLLRGQGGTGSDLLTVGAGVSWLFFGVGPMATIGYEHRF